MSDPKPMLQFDRVQDEEEGLEVFLEWVMERGIELYPAQEEAVLEVFGGNHVILNTPTGSGKSLVAIAMHYRALIRNERSFYTSPIKALVSEKFFSLCETFGAEHVGMMTGDASVNRDAPIICCTQEILANLALREGHEADVQHAIIDEFHYYSDKDRGRAWQVPLLLLSDTTFLLMSATIGDITTIEESLHKISGRDISVVRSDDRPVPLEFSWQETTLHETIRDLAAKDKAPVYVVNFSQREAAEQAQGMMSVDFCSREEKKAIAKALKGVKFPSPYGKDVQRYLRHGIGIHHAGLLPRYRLLVERLAQQGMLKVISGTDTLGVGVNVPIRTVLFTRLFKFDGEKNGILTVRDFQQIAGRAGRKGYDDKGWVVCQAPEHVIENLKLAAKAASTGRKFKKKKAPEKWYVPWNADTFNKLMSGRPEPLESRFKIDHGLLLSMLQGGSGWDGVVDLIDRTHESPGGKTYHLREAELARDSLVTAEVLEEENGEWFVNEDLQFNFSLNHTLSLYLLDALPRLEEDRETWPLDVMTLVESILENPRAILMRQLDKIKGELIGQWKAEGIEYDERMERLEKVTWPKPNKEWIWATFDDFSAKHPWVSTENIKPKSVAREMFESYVSFDDYVRDYGLERSEGVLLRYLSQVYKTMLQNVPETYHTDELVDILAFLRALLARIDSSLVREWEAMQGIEHAEDLVEPDPEAERRALAADANPRAFRARIRAEMHALVRALAQKDYDEAALCVRQPLDEPWDANRLQEAIAPFYEDHDKLIWSHEARLTDKTSIVEDGFRRWEVTQIFVDPEGDNEWSARAIVDLPLVEEERERLGGDDGPLITLQSMSQ